MRARHMSPRPEQAYVGWIRRFVRYHDLRHPAELGDPEVVDFLTHLATAQRVARSTQIQAMSAIQFPYRFVLHRPLGDVASAIRSTAPAHLPVVLTREEERQVLAQLSGDLRLIGMCLYGSGLRLNECLTLRVKDVDLSVGEFRLRRGKGGEDRVTMIPMSGREALAEQLDCVKRLHDSISRLAPAVCSFRRRWKQRRGRGQSIWVGSGCSRRGDGTAMLGRARSGATSFTRRSCSARCGGLFALAESRSTRAATPGGIRSRRTCSKMGTTFGRCRSSWGIPVSARRWFIHMC